MKFILQVVLIFSLYLWLQGCRSPSHLSPADTLDRKIQTEEQGGKLYLKASGLCGHSAYGLEKLVASSDKDSMTMRIKIKLEGTGSFSEKIEIPANISSIYWDDVLIWSRPVKPRDKPSVQYAKPGG